MSISKESFYKNIPNNFLLSAIMIIIYVDYYYDKYDDNDGCFDDGIDFYDDSNDAFNLIVIEISFNSIYDNKMSNDLIRFDLVFFYFVVVVVILVTILMKKKQKQKDKKLIFFQPKTRFE